METEHADFVVNGCTLDNNSCSGEEKTAWQATGSVSADHREVRRYAGLQQRVSTVADRRIITYFEVAWHLNYFDLTVSVKRSTILRQIKIVVILKNHSKDSIAFR